MPSWGWPSSPVALAVMRAVGALYVRMSGRMLARRGPGWAVPVSLLVAAATGLLLWNWVTQSL